MPTDGVRRADTTPISLMGVLVRWRDRLWWRNRRAFPPAQQYVIRSLVDGDLGERWVHLGDILDFLRREADRNARLDHLVSELERYRARLDEDAAAGRTGRNRLRLVDTEDRTR